MNEDDVAIAIDELFLDGPLAARAGAIREALAAHLARLVAERGAPTELRLDRAAFDVPPELGADAIGARVAEGLYQRLTGGRR